MPIRVALVGRRLEHNENLGLAYLRAALERAGMRADTYFVNDPAELAAAVERILATRPSLVGLSLADGGSAMLPLAVGEALVEGGFSGHISAGGQFATLAREWLLERYAWLSSVVRFAGEGPLVEIAERVTRGEPVRGIPGVTTRFGDGAPARVLESGAFALRPARDELPQILGHSAAHIMATLGCLGRCRYCGPAALHTLERQEGVRSGIPSAALTSAGVGGIRRRAIESVCDEMAELWHERDVRYFYFVDEHLLPYSEPDALELLGLWKSELAARKLGAFGIGTMLRADRITPAIVHAFVDLGLVRVFLGLELACEEEGRRFGRRAPGPRELALIEDFAAAGVVTVSNLMLVHPYSTPETIAGGVDLLESIPGGVFEATRMMVYHGTRLMRTVEEEGRLDGNPFRYGYRFRDPAVERFAEIFTRLRAEAFYDYSVAFRTHDAFLALGLARRIHPERVAPELRARLERTRAAVNVVYVDAYRRALELALSGGGFAEAQPLVASIRARVAELELELDSVERRLGEIAHHGGRPFAPMRSAAAGVVTFALAACATDAPRPETPEIVQATAPEPSPEELEPPAEASRDASAATAAEAGGAPSALPEAAPPTEACTDPEFRAVEQDVKKRLAKSASCFSGVITLSDPPKADFGMTHSGYSSGRICNWDGAGRHVAAAEHALAGKVRRCDDDMGQPRRIPVDGRANQDSARVLKAIATCQTNWGGNVQVVLDAKGLVTRVVATPATPASRCIHNVLRGLRFPCLSSFEVCPEHVIIE